MDVERICRHIEYRFKRLTRRKRLGKDLFIEDQNGGKKDGPNMWADTMHQVGGIIRQS